MLSVYVKELSREFPAIVQPEQGSIEEIVLWRQNLKPSRSDIQNGVQVLGRLRRASGQPLDEGEIDLAGAKLQCFDLSNLAFNGVSLSNANLQQANLTGTSLCGADLNDTKLQWADITNTDFQNAHLERANLSESDCSSVVLRGANLRYATMLNVNLTNAKLQGADLTNATLQGSVLSHVRFNGANLKYTDIDGAMVTNSQFDSATSFVETSLRGVALKSVDLSTCKVSNYQILHMFGDATVTLPKGTRHNQMDRPDHWSDIELDHFNFLDHWHAFQLSIGQSPNYDPFL
jgi:uncharacterized protein YjbI with pentapeptide repeats